MLRPEVECIRSCSETVLLHCDEHSDQKQLGEEGVIWIALPGNWKPTTEELRNSGAEAGITGEGCFMAPSLLLLASFLI